MSEPENHRLSPAAEERLLALLAVVAAEAPRAEDSAAERIMRTARWQYAVRGTLVFLSELTTTLVDGALLLLGLRR